MIPILENEYGYSGFLITLEESLKIPENLKIEKAYHYDFCMLANTEEIAYLKSIGAQEQFMECDYFGFKIENKEKENNVFSNKRQLKHSLIKL